MEFTWGFARRCLWRQDPDSDSYPPPPPLASPLPLPPSTLLPVPSTMLFCFSTPDPGATDPGGYRAKMNLLFLNLFLLGICHSDNNLNTFALNFIGGSLFSLCFNTQIHNSHLGRLTTFILRCSLVYHSVYNVLKMFLKLFHGLIFNTKALMHVGFVRRTYCIIFSHHTPIPSYTGEEAPSALYLWSVCLVLV